MSKEELDMACTEVDMSIICTALEEEYDPQQVHYIKEEVLVELENQLDRWFTPVQELEDVQELDYGDEGPVDVTDADLFVSESPDRSRRRLG